MATPVITTGVVVAGNEKNVVEMQPVVVEPPTTAAVPGVIVTTQPRRSQYISGFCCWDNCQCQRDCGLCCYTICCPMCAYADIMANTKSGTCCCPVGFGYSLACITGCLFVGVVASCVNLVPCISCTSREALGHKYGLPTNDCCCACCAHCCCQTCALYQESVYVKHVLLKEPTCCCYFGCQDCCGKVDIGDYPNAPERTTT